MVPPASTDTLPIADAPPSDALVARVGDALRAGGVVAMPTETVYGLAVRADRTESLDALARLKGSPPGRPWTWHVGSPEALESFDVLAPLARRLAARYWPGPLTMLLQGVPRGLEAIASEGAVGLRMPAHAGVAGILAAIDVPVAMTSANPAGAPPLQTAAELTKTFPEGLALVLDGGPSRLGEPSAVLRVVPGAFELLREGLLSVDTLRRTAGLELLFVCTGNTCRSPMAEALARAALARRLEVDDPAAFGFGVRSAGVFAPPGAPASEHSVAVLAKRGLDLSRHRSSGAEDELLERADRIYGLTRSHLEALAARSPVDLREKLFLLDPTGRDVPDPIGGSLADYAACAQAIERAITARLDEWA